MNLPPTKLTLELAYFKSDTLLDHRLFAGGRNYPIALALIALEGAAFFLIINFSAAQSALVFGATGFGIGGRLFMVFLGLMSGGVRYMRIVAEDS